MRRRDTAVVAALRSALSAIANAEAATPVDPGTSTTGSIHFAGSASGLGAAEVERLTRTEEQQRAIVIAEAAELSGHVERLNRLCRQDEADAARRALQILTRILDVPG
jgi:uncharacterized protein